MKFIYGGTHYWVHETNPKTPRERVIGPFKLP
jgi:hypothetical protein